LIDVQRCVRSGPAILTRAQRPARSCEREELDGTPQQRAERREQVLARTGVNEVAHGQAPDHVNDEHTLATACDRPVMRAAL